MNKTDLIKKVASEAGLSRSKASEAVEAMLGGIQEALGRNEDVVILGFGSFSVVDRAPRAGRHPQTGKPMHIPATRQARFKPGKTLKELVK